MAASVRTELQCATTLMCLALISITADAACIQSYTDKSISYIENNKAQSTIYYLGTKSSATQCRDSCIDFNYLCDKSSSYILDSNGASIDWDTENCEITINADGGSSEYIKITDEPILSSNYIIDLELTMLTQSSGSEAGLYWKSSNDDDNYYDYYFNINLNSHCSTGYSDPTVPNEYEHLSTAGPKPSYNTRYTLRTTVSGSSFTTYLNGQQHYSGTLRSGHTSYGWCGIWGYDADITYHSFKITFPNGGSEEKVCAAYLFDSSNRCYGYYGTAFTTIENSVLSKSNHDCGIIYPDSCPTSSTSEPSPKPTVNPSERPSNQPTVRPTVSPVTASQPTLPPLSEPTLKPTVKPTAKPLSETTSTKTPNVQTTVYPTTTTRDRPSESPFVVIPRSTDPQFDRKINETDGIESDKDRIRKKKSYMVEIVVAGMILVIINMFCIMICCIFLCLKKEKVPKIVKQNSGSLPSEADSGENIEKGPGGYILPPPVPEFVFSEMGMIFTPGVGTMTNTQSHLIVPGEGQLTSAIVPCGEDEYTSESSSSSWSNNKTRTVKDNANDDGGEDSDSLYER